MDAPSKPHSYGWNDLISCPTADLQVGDVFVTPAPLHMYRGPARDGSVVGIGVCAWDGPAGTAWTVTARDGDRFTLTAYDGRVQDPAYMVVDMVLRVLPMPDAAEVRARGRVIKRAAAWLAQTDPAQVSAVLAAVRGLNRSLGPDHLARMLLDAKPGDGARGRGAFLVASWILDAATAGPNSVAQSRETSTQQLELDLVPRHDS